MKIDVKAATQTAHFSICIIIQSYLLSVKRKIITHEIHKVCPYFQFAVRIHLSRSELLFTEPSEMSLTFFMEQQTRVVCDEQGI